MGTKLNPGKYDCWPKLADDEPFFILRAKDPVAPTLIRLWIALTYSPEALRELAAETRYDKLDEAEYCASSMEVWRRNQKEQPDAV